jgi:hypothetical protein
MCLDSMLLATRVSMLPMEVAEYHAENPIDLLISETVASNRSVVGFAWWWRGVNGNRDAFETGQGSRS